MNNNKKNYEDEFKFDENQLDIKISFERVAFIFFCFFVISFIFSAKVIVLGFKNNNATEILQKKENFRASILDRNDNIIAKTVPIINLGINPNLVIDKERLLINLKLLFPEKDFNNKIYGKKFFYVKKKISQKKLNQVLLLGDKSFIQEESISRIYPNESLYSHILGQIDNDNNGISGIEKSFDYELSTKKNPLKLTLDTDIQFLIREELVKSQNIFNNIGSAAILMDIHSGEILSLVSLPDFNLNERKKIVDKRFINRATKGIYEFGSVFKTFTLAAGIQYGVISPDTEFKDLKKKIYCANNTISEYDDKIPSDLTAEQILIRSGNIGSARIAEKIGIDNFSEFLKKIGILDFFEFDLQETGSTQIGNWGKCRLLTVAFGHGIATSLIQLTKAYAIISNGGFDINPTILKKDKIKKGSRVLNKGVSNQLNKILRKIVSTKDGTAGFANVKGYEIGGKTGTAEVAVSGGYSKKKINTFASVFPTSNPKFALVVMLDEPKANKEFVYTYRDDRQPYKGNWRNTAGWTTVWITGQIIEKIGPILATKY